MYAHDVKKEGTKMAGLSTELVANKQKLCDKHYPKCITSGCPLARYFCYEVSDICKLYANSQLGAKRKITKILKETGESE